MALIYGVDVIVRRSLGITDHRCEADTCNGTGRAMLYSSCPNESLFVARFEYPHYLYSFRKVTRMYLCEEHLSAVYQWR